MESNHRTQVRSLLLYPLSYGAGFGQSSAGGRGFGSTPLA